jgi:hypothetical protein
VSFEAVSEHSAPAGLSAWDNRVALQVCSWWALAPLSIARRVEERDRLPAIASIDAEVGKIRCDDNVLRIEFAHSNETEISKVGLPVAIALGEFANPLYMVGQPEGELDQTRFYKIQDQTDITEMKCGLRKHWFAGEEWRGDPLCNIHRPPMMKIGAITESDKKSSVRDSLHFLENPLRCDERGSVETRPAKRINGRLSKSRALSNCCRMMLLCDMPDLAAVVSNHSAS